MSIEKYEIMQEFLRIAEDMDLLGLKKEAASKKNTPKENENVVKEKNIIEEAHPEPVYIAEAHGDGGLVENQIEQQKKLIEIINKMPTGSLVGRYANAALQLVKAAELCDDANHEEAADLLIEAATLVFDQITKDSSDLPFVEAPIDQ